MSRVGYVVIDDNLSAECSCPYSPDGVPKWIDYSCIRCWRKRARKAEERLRLALEVVEAARRVDTRKCLGPSQPCSGSLACVNCTLHGVLTAFDAATREGPK